jgi:uncharacterized membrane protein YgcG
MRSLPLTLLAAAAILGPAAAYAATPAGPAAASGAANLGMVLAPARYFEISALVLGGARTEVSGKLAIEGIQLIASVGCNTIGGTVSVTGDTVTIVGPMSMTEMGCPGTVGDAEATLVEVLDLRTFTITETGWIAKGGEIVTAEIPSANPVPIGTPPDGVPASCPPNQIDNGSTSVGSGPATGSGGGMDGSTGSGSSGSGSRSGSTGTGNASPGTVVVEPAPGSLPGSEPGATPISEPGSTGTVDAAPPAPPAPNPGETGPGGEVAPEPSLGIVLPDPIGVDPGVGRPVDPCTATALSNGQIVPDGGAAPKAGEAATATDDVARDTAQVPTAGLIALGALVLVVLLGAGLYWRSRPTGS